MLGNMQKIILDWVWQRRKWEKKHTETVSHKTSKSIKSFLSPKETNVQLKIVTAQLVWAYHTNTLFYHSLYGSTELSKVTLLIHSLELKRAMGRFENGCAGLCIRLLGLP